MTKSATPGGSGTEPAADGYDTARIYLRRATWAMAVLVAAMLVSLGFAQVARSRQATFQLHNRDIARVALATQLAATSRARASRIAFETGDQGARELAVAAANRVRANLDTLTRDILADSADTSAIDRIAGIRTAIDAWDKDLASWPTATVRGLAHASPSTAPFDSVAQRLDRLVRDENGEFEHRVDAQRALARTAESAFMTAVVVLGLIAAQMRRQLSRGLARASENHKTIRGQNVLLQAKTLELEARTEQLQVSAAEREIQAAALGAQTAALESTVQELRQAEQRQRALADDSAVIARRLTEAQRVAQLGYWEIDSATGEVFWSDEMYALAGIEPAVRPVPTDRFIAAVHPDDRQRMQEVAARAVTELAEFTEQYRLPLRGGAPGAWRTVQARGRIVIDQSGRRKLVGTVQDISDRVVLETQLRRAQKMEAVGQLAGGVAHDFNNILTVIEGYSGLLLIDRVGSDSFRDDVEEIRAAAARAATLTRQLLAFSRQQVLQPRVLDLNAAIGGVEKMLRRLIGEHIEFRTRLEPKLDQITADPGQIEQVIVNLVVNARDAMPNGGILTIETSNIHLDASQAHRIPIKTPGPHAMLAISDSGTGIAPENMERIFEPFFTTKESGRGTGLGLSTVHGIVEQSGGYISVYSEPGHGTTFKLYFPRSAADAAPAPDPRRPPSSPTGSETLMLVEDDVAVRTVARAVLRRAGYTVIEAQDGIQALRIAADPNVSIDIVLTDMVMPGMGGRDLATQLRQSRPSLPVVFMSGYTRDAMIHSTGFAAGEYFIEKPFAPDTLTRKVRDVLDRAGGRETSQ